MRTAMLILTALLAALPAGAQQTPPAVQRRMQLEQQVLQRFVQRVSTEMALDEAARPRLRTLVQEFARQRRALNQQGVMLHRRLQLALQNESTPDAQFLEIFADQRTLREREHELWLREQTELQQLLTPRQRAQYTLRWLRLQEDARTLLQQRAPRQPVR